LLNSNSISLIKLKGKRRLLKGEKLYKPYLISKIKESFNKKTNKRESRRVKRLYANLSRYYLVSVCGFRYPLVVLCNTSKIV
jgi:anaerobic ribonucleoside-triphosphate reductase